MVLTNPLTAPRQFLKKRELTRAVELLETLVGGEGEVHRHFLLFSC